MQMNSPLSIHHQSPGVPPRPADRSVPGSYQIAAFTLGPGAHEILCAPFKSEASISPNPGELLQSSPAGLQNQMLWGAPLPCAGPPG